MIAVEIEGFPSVEWADLWPRVQKYGTAEGYCGGGIIITISRAFTDDEDKIFRWVMAQDEASLWGVQHLSDGRDLLIFERGFKTQNRTDAITEHREHIAKWLRTIPSQHNTSATRRG